MHADLNTKLRQTPVEKDIARVVHSSLSDENKVAALVELLRKQVELALHGQTENLLQFWGVEVGRG
jgi:hypothetical protein